MALRPFTRHDPAGHARYQELKQLARSQGRVLPGAPGMLKQRSRRGTDYWVREYIRIDGRKDDEHIGTVDKVDPQRLKEMQAQIDLAKALVAGSSKLRLFGYQRVERKTAAVLAALFNHGLFQAGLTLVGSHAYGALLNELGIAAGYTTQDIDQALAVALPEGMEVRRLVKESGATPAQAIPFLDFLVEDPLDAVILAPNHVVPVKVPAPERFVLHKLYSSQSRRADRDKVRKDLRQAAVIAAALEEEAPAALDEALRAMPRAGRAAGKNGARAAANLLNDYAVRLAMELVRPRDRAPMLYGVPPVFMMRPDPKLLSTLLIVVVEIVEDQIDRLQKNLRRRRHSAGAHPYEDVRQRHA